MLEHTHKCNNCGDHIEGKCYCWNCRENAWLEAYTKGKADGKKEAYDQGYADAVKHIAMDAI